MAPFSYSSRASLPFTAKLLIRCLYLLTPMLALTFFNKAFVYYTKMENELSLVSFLQHFCALLILMLFYSVHIFKNYCILNVNSNIFPPSHSIIEDPKWYEFLIYWIWTELSEKDLSLLGTDTPAPIVFLLMGFEETLMHSPSQDSSTLGF